MRLGIDLDGVVAQFNKGWMQRHREQFGSDLDPAMVTSWDGLDRLAGFGSMSEFWTWFRNGDGPSWFRHLDTYPNAMDTIHRLRDAGHDIVILTHKFDWSIPDTFGWLSDIGMPSREVHILGDKYRIECDVYLDDSPLVLPELVENRPAATVCRFVRPWNVPVEGAVDIRDWAEFESIVTETSSTS